MGNVHEVAQAANPLARIVYVDHDPVAVAQSLALLAGNDRATAISGDVRDPHRVLEQAVGTGLLDLDRPLGVLFIAVLQFIDDAERPAALIAEFMSATRARQLPRDQPSASIGSPGVRCRPRLQPVPLAESHAVPYAGGGRVAVR